mmetsp:Transcript_29802/g.91256  ORF Transcript_29802/g.91256 Transcript_29802/m.91256 type:complete len:464 (-) Transcript_29802:4-1395(-)
MAMREGLLGEVEVAVVGGGEFAHDGGPDHDVDGFVEAVEDVVLDVGDAVLGADGLDDGLGLAVGEHGEVGPHVVFDLVVQEALEEVEEVVAAVEVGGGDDLPQIERGRPGLAVLLEAVQVVASVVGDDAEEGVPVREGFCQKESADGLRVRSGEQEGQRQEEEALDEVRQEAARQEFRTPEERLVSAAQQPREVEDLGAVRIRKFRQALLAALRDLQVLVGIRRVVPPLPRRRQQQKHEELFHELGHLQFAKVDHVHLHQVGVLDFSQMIVVELVVLDVPGLDEHPVEPVDRSPVRGAHAELEARIRRALVEAAVAHVVANDGPPRHRPRRQQKGREERDDATRQSPETRRDRDQQTAQPLARTAPPDDLLQVRGVRGALVLAELLAQVLALLAEGGHVQPRDPLLRRRQLRRGVARPRQQLLAVLRQHQARRHFTALAHSFFLSLRSRRRREGDLSFERVGR